MSTFKEFFDRKTPSCLIVYCPSDLYFDEMVQYWRGVVGVTPALTERILSGKQLLATSERNKVPPLFEKGYMFVYDAKLNKEFIPDELTRLMQGNACAYYLVRVSDYRKFKQYQQKFSSSRFISLETFSVMKKEEFYFFYKEKVTKYADMLLKEGQEQRAKKMHVSSKLLDFVAYDYARDIEKIFKFFMELRNGFTPETASDVILRCGASVRNLNKLLFSFLKIPKMSNRSINTMLKRKLFLGKDFKGTYGYSGLLNFLIKNIKGIVEYKYVVITGQLVGNRLVDLDKSHDTKNLKKWSFYEEELSQYTLEYLMLLLGVLVKFKNKHIKDDEEWQELCIEVLNFKLSAANISVGEREFYLKLISEYKGEWFEYVEKQRANELKKIEKGSLTYEGAKFVWV